MNPEEDSLIELRPQIKQVRKIDIDAINRRSKPINEKVTVEDVQPPVQEAPTVAVKPGEPEPEKVVTAQVEKPAPEAKPQPKPQPKPTPTPIPEPSTAPEPQPVIEVKPAQEPVKETTSVEV